MAGGFHLTSALAFLSKGEVQWSDGEISNMENDDNVDDSDANDVSVDEGESCIRKQTYNWRQEHHEEGEGGTEASKYRWQSDLFKFFRIQRQVTLIFIMCCFAQRQREINQRKAMAKVTEMVTIL